MDTKLIGVLNLLPPMSTLKYVKTGCVLSTLEPFCIAKVKQVLVSLGRLTLGLD